jgi:hypothetical protein
MGVQFCTNLAQTFTLRYLRWRLVSAMLGDRIGEGSSENLSMSYRSLALIAAVAALSSMHVASAAALDRPPTRGPPMTMDTG